MANFELHQKRLLQSKSFLITEDALTIKERFLLNRKEYRIPLRNIGKDKVFESDKNKIFLLSIFGAPLYFILALIMSIFILKTYIAFSLAFISLAIIAAIIYLVVLRKMYSGYVKLYGGQGSLEFMAHLPSDTELDTFIDTLIEVRNTHAINFCMKAINLSSYKEAIEELNQINNYHYYADEEDMIRLKELITIHFKDK